MRCSGPAIKKFISVLTLSNVAAAATAARRATSSALTETTTGAEVRVRVLLGAKLNLYVPDATLIVTPL
jgi:hypothetical protein